MTSERVNIAQRAHIYSFSEDGPRGNDGVSPGDPLTLGGVVVAMCIIGLAASYIPARRASLADPMVSLREE